MTRLRTIRTICCHCGSLIRDGETLDGCVSHGICPECLAERYPDLPEEEVENDDSENAG